MKHTNHRFVSILLVMVMLVLAAVPASGAAAGTGPDDALAPPHDWQQMEAGEQLWYAFQYAGDGSQITVRLEIVPEESATFALWTPEGIERWGLGLEAEPIGRGSADSGNKGLLTWSGNFTTQGTYYVVVEHTGSQPGTSYYLLKVEGDGVTLSASAPAATPEPQPAKSKPKAKPSTLSKLKGKLLFQTTIGGPFYTINVDGTGLRRITDGIDPHWSPDGRQIAFARWRDPRGIWVIDADGSGEWRAFDWDEARWPSWSPDGERLLFSRQHGGRAEEVQKCFWGFCFTIGAHPHWRLGTVRLSDSDFREPPSPLFCLAPDWSSEGRIVYDAEHGLRVQSEDGETSYLITHDARDTGPIWSPDGQRVVFTRRQHDHWEVYVVDADGRNLTRLTDTPKKPNGEVGSSAAPAWSPDGQHLAFLTDRTGEWEIWVMNANGQKQRPLFEDALAGLTIEYASVAERAISWTE